MSLLVQWRVRMNVRYDVMQLLRAGSAQWNCLCLRGMTIYLGHLKPTWLHPLAASSPRPYSWYWVQPKTDLLCLELHVYYTFSLCQKQWFNLAVYSHPLSKPHRWPLHISALQAVLLPLGTIQPSHSQTSIKIILDQDIAKGDIQL